MIRSLLDLVLASALAAPAAPAAGGTRPAESEAAARRTEDLRRELQRLRGLESRYSHAAASVIGEIDSHSREILIADRELELTRALLRQGELALAELDEHRRTLERRVEEGRAGLRRALLAAYENRVNRASPELWAVLTAREPSELPQSLRRIERLSAAQTRAIREFEAARGELLETRQAIERGLAGQVRLAGAMEERRAGAERARGRKVSLLRDIQGRRSEATSELRTVAAELRSTFGALGRTEAGPAPTGFPGLRGQLPWPVEGLIAQRFGVESHPRFHTLIEHPGIEISTPGGAPVRAVHEGEVVYSDWFKGYGLLVILAHGEGYYSLYAHLSATAVQRGQKVGTAALIGRAGESGLDTESGIYFEIRRGDQAQDPESWLVRRARPPRIKR